jgi:hypothetical protein
MAQGCNCYVKALSDHEQFMLRYGAHTKCCPVYRESRDPVDRINDKITRACYLEQFWPEYAEEV